MIYIPFLMINETVGVVDDIGSSISGTMFPFYITVLFHSFRTLRFKKFDLTKCFHTSLYLSVIGEL